MRTLLLSASLLVLTTLQAQEPSLYIVPRWKVGETRTLDITQVQRTLTDGVTGEQRDQLRAVVRVANEDPNAYILRVQFDNVIMHHLRQLGAAIKTDLTPYEHIMLRYSVARKDGRAHLENWQEAQALVRKCADAVMKGVQKQDTVTAKVVANTLMPMMAAFNDQDDVEAFFREVIDYVVFPFGKRMGDTDTLRTVDYHTNPFAPADSVPVTTTTRLEKIDREQQQATVHGTVSYDLSAFKLMALGLMQQMTASQKMSAADRKKAQAKMDAQLKTARFDITTDGSYTMDLRTTWPLGYTGTQRLAASQGGHVNETVTTTTVTVTP